ncbi:MAG: HAD-IIIA family hydrolase, partial [Gammaproteobacteria bacterium]|nr:HAD-IIIA family hydrolase [Gammaproteobacteria bacterium]
MRDDVLQRAALVQLAVFDVDGVLTDGRLILGDDGQEYKAFHSRDGHGLRMLQDSGITVAIITGRTSHVVAKRTRELGIEHVYQGHRDKLPALRELLDLLQLPGDAAAYVGDDVVDLPVMRRVGLAVAVGDAHTYVKRHAHWVTDAHGG